MTVNESIFMAGEVYVLGIAIALGMAALIKLINYIIRKTDQNAAAKTQPPGGEGGES